MRLPSLLVLRANLNGLYWLTKDKLQAYSADVRQEPERKFQQVPRSMYDNCIRGLIAMCVMYVVFAVIWTVGWLLFK